jgi:hypothetical protein
MRKAMTPKPRKNQALGVDGESQKASGDDREKAK